MKTLVLLAILVVGLLHTPTALAGKLITAKAQEVDGHYTLTLDMNIHGKYRDVYAVLIDFNNLSRVNDTIKTSQLLESKDGVHLITYTSEGCVFIFCRTVKQTATVTELGRGFIMSIVDPTRSDLKYGKTLWQVIDEGDTTRIKYNADYVPDFWIPPIIGPSIFQDRMIEEGVKTVNGIEKLVHTSFE